MSKATPGPWKVGYEAFQVTAGSMNICDIRGWGHLTGKGALGLPAEEAKEIQESNARLIAAAPEMLELIREFLSEAKLVKAYTSEGSVYLHPNDFKPLTTKLIERAVAIIAKAENRT